MSSCTREAGTTSVPDGDSSRYSGEYDDRIVYTITATSGSFFTSSRAPEGSREFVLGHRVDLDLVHGDGDALDPIRAHQHQGGLTPLGLRRLAGEQVHHTEATST
jgi:hypothetical protein